MERGRSPGQKWRQTLWCLGTFAVAFSVAGTFLTATIEEVVRETLFD